MLNEIRNGLLRSNTLLEKIMPLLTPAAIAFGVLNESRLLPFTWLVPWIFAFMTLIGSLKSNFRDLLAVLLKPQKLIILMVILHVVMPLIGWVAAKAFSGRSLYGYGLCTVVRYSDWSRQRGLGIHARRQCGTYTGADSH